MIVIDPGHGGFDPGGGSNDFWKEKDLALSISKYQFERFQELGIPVKMTRYNDTTLSPEERADLVNDAFGSSPDVIAISNHINNDAGKADGAEFIYSISETSTLPDMMANEIKNAGQNIRGVYQRRNSKGDDYYFIIRDTRPIQTIIAEYGFADSPGNDIELLLYEWPELAESVVKATAEYMGISYLPPSTVVYIVKPNDSLYKIAQKYNTSVEDIKQLSKITSDSIYPGQILIVRNNVARVTNSYNEDYIIYTVQQGDTLGNLAWMYNTSVSTIQLMNNIVNIDEIFIGQQIKIPQNYILYTIKKGDTLYSLAQKYNTSVEVLQNINGITDVYNLIIGSVIKIPTERYIEYIVKPGDSLYIIATNFNTSVEKLMSDNNLTSDMIYPGQKLIIL